jgi:hypothetical protein
MTTLIKSTATDVYRELFADAAPDSEVFAAGLDNELAAGLVDALAASDDPPTVHLLMADSILKWFRRDFHLASTTAELVAAGELELRVTDDVVANAVITTEQAVVSLMRAEDQVAGLGTNDEAFVASMREQCEEAWATADTTNLRTPPRTRVYETLAGTFGSDVEADYRAMLDAVGTTRSSGSVSVGTADDNLDEITLVLLAGAKRKVQLFELSTWGEDVGLASRATFSRVKTALEDHGIIETEKIPIDVGRPRQRLVLANSLRGYEASDLPAAVRDELQAAPA